MALAGSLRATIQTIGSPAPPEEQSIDSLTAALLLEADSLEPASTHVDSGPEEEAGQASVVAVDGQQGSQETSYDDPIEKFQKTPDDVLTQSQLKELVVKHIKEGNYDDVETCVSNAIGKGGETLSDRGIFNTVINAYANIGDVEGATSWLRHMVEREIAPNNATYGMLCKAYAHHGEARKIQDIMDKLEAAGGRLNEYFYAALLSACGRAQPRETARAERAVWELSLRGLRTRSVRGVLAMSIGVEAADKLLAKVEAASGKSGRCKPWEKKKRPSGPRL